MRLRFGALREYLRTGLWFVPAVCVAIAVAGAWLSLALDRGRAGGGFLAFTGSPESAQTLLSAIASSIVTLTALVFSVTVVALQLASSQYSPRVLRSFLRDRLSQAALGVFLATFVYTMLVLRSIRSSGDERLGFVPEISVNVAYGLVGLSLCFFVAYIHHVAQSMQASSIVAEVAAESRDALRRLYPTTGTETVDASRAALRSAGVVVGSQHSGYLQAVDEDRLLELASEHDLQVQLIPSVGDFVADGARLMIVTGRCDEQLTEELRSCTALGGRRTMQQDPRFGFRQLVDIAEKALSPGINDPTTAVEATDRILELMVVLADREIPSPLREDEAGVVRLELPRPSWEDFVALAFDEIRHYGQGSSQVTQRLRTALDELCRLTVPERRAPLLERLDLLDRSAERGFDDPEDVARVRRAGRSGRGQPADLHSGGNIEEDST